jgi:hypothetical protein
MPADNNFQHSIYSRADPGDRVAYREFNPGAPPDSLAWQDAMADFGARLATAGVRAVLFLHGTFVNTDLFGLQRLDEVGGLKRGYSRGIPGVEALLALMREGSNGLPSLPDGPKPPFEDSEPTHKLLDDRAGDAANFTAAYVDLFNRAVNRKITRPIVCSRILWSGEQHHLGRAKASIRLLRRLRTMCEELHLGSGDRILIHAHGQAGLVVALLSNVLASRSTARDRFFEFIKSGGSSDDLMMQTEFLAQGDPLSGARLDVVTFGTPVRYGWDPSALGHLLHIVNHRPMRLDGKRWLAKFELPQITMEMPIAWGGDYVQQLAVAASDAVPPSPEGKAANKALWELLEPWEGFERWMECARKAVRCQNDGHCLLVDYKDSGSSNPSEHIYGHAAYTRTQAMLFNAMEIARILYG